MAEDDFIWRFSVEPRLDCPVFEDPLTELVRVFLADLLNIGVLLEGEHPVTVDGFAFANDRSRVYSIYPQVGEGGVAKEVPLTHQAGG